VGTACYTVHRNIDPHARNKHQHLEESEYGLPSVGEPTLPPGWTRPAVTYPVPHHGAILTTSTTLLRACDPAAESCRRIYIRSVIPATHHFYPRVPVAVYLLNWGRWSQLSWNGRRDACSSRDLQHNQRQTPPMALEKMNGRTSESISPDGVVRAYHSLWVFWYTWAADRQTHWIVPIIGTGFIGVGSMFVMVCKSGTHSLMVGVV
jgi:hypothetical protein